jgi:hypothetical protein
MKKNKSDVFRKASLGGSVIAAISASLCCLGPVVAVLMGASGFEAAGLFAKWRPVFLSTTFAFLALAWFLTYGKPKSDCAGDGCAATLASVWNKGVLWLATGFVLVAAGFPALSSGVVQVKQAETCCVSPYKTDANTDRPQFKKQSTEAVNTNLVSFYQVPLVCPAAPQIGCGSASKPVLLGLERADAVSEAWLNRAGTIMAVVWSDRSKMEQRTGTINAVLKEQCYEMTANELPGNEKQRILKGFLSRSGWYRGAEVDRLSEEEAAIIAARLVRRVQAKTTLPPEKAQALQSAMTDALKKRFTDNKVKQEQEQNALLKSGDGLQQVVGEFLDKEQIPILKEAIASGLRPLPNEK